MLAACNGCQQTEDRFMDEFNDRTDPLRLLATRRSGKARDMIEPGPDEAQLRHILSIASRVPDHGKLAPWRFVIVPKEAREALADVIERAYLAQKPDAVRLERLAMRDFATQAPTLVVVMSKPAHASHIPLWEQELSGGAAVMNLLNAAHAMGFVGNWLTGWPTFSTAVRDALGEPDERIAGFVFLGTPGKPLEERPRPDLESVVRIWKPASTGA